MLILIFIELCEPYKFDTPKILTKLVLLRHGSFIKMDYTHIHSINTCKTHRKLQS